MSKKKKVSAIDIIPVSMDEHVQQGDIFKDVKYIFDFINNGVSKIYSRCLQK